MNPQVLATIFVTAAWVCATAKIDHDKVQPFSQPTPVTISEKAAITFKPQLYTPKSVCVPFPAANAYGEITGGLKGSNGNDACVFPPLGSQVYGRVGWFRDVWAIMYAWYFPKGFWMGFVSRRHDWKNVVVWIDNPGLEEPKILGVSMSKSETKYTKERRLWPSNFAGFYRMGRRYDRSYIYGFNTFLRFYYHFDVGTPNLYLSEWEGEYQDLIMWEQLTDVARAALNGSNNFEEVEVPISDEHFETRLDEAWLF
ncbi:NPP1-like protein [Phytophthora infestans T30-4]|uniref:NPP1-like protein n=1 Tax=Phytophthora infestans (strain T30-4) TaxID=403677 RepID=D0RM12_PHYIT|nr:NPP1-like protein [Phytophthora infestans T30-4]EEY57056.1 NPP1-like protein [Phytophthora infestans T30-4]|eukprot:XP_002909918.1 NPP1-like protein [Phytophthora infestans T30-4]